MGRLVSLIYLNRQIGRKVRKLKSNRVKCFILFYVLLLGLSFFEFIPLTHVFECKHTKKKHLLYHL